MSELTLTVVRLGLLLMLWLFIFSIVSVLRGDLYGTRIVQRSGAGVGRSIMRPKANTPAVVKKSGQPTLTVIEGPMRGTSVPLRESGVLLGRNPECTLVLDDDYASGRHCRIFAAESVWYVEDLGSTNGTFIGAGRVTDTEPLPEGSPLRIGSTIMELRR